MSRHLLHDIDEFRAQHGLSDFAFSYHSTGNGRLLERLRKGGRVWPETELQIRAWMLNPVPRKRKPKEDSAERAA